MNASVHIDEASYGDGSLPFPPPVFAGFYPAAHVALVSWRRLGCTLGRGLLCVFGLGVVLPTEWSAGKEVTVRKDGNGLWIRVSFETFLPNES